MKFFSKNRLISFALGVLSLVTMWLVWFIAEKTVKNQYVLPGFAETMVALGKVLGEPFFWQATGRTLLKVIYAFAISFILAGALAALGKIFRPFGTFLKPFISVVRTLPTMAILVLILIYTNRTTAPVVVATLVLFPMIYAQFNTALNSVDEGIIAAAKVFDLSKKDRVFKVYLPMVAPNVLSHVGSNLSFGIKLVISAEIMAYTFTSLGGMMQSANALLDVTRLSALTIVAVVLGLVVELVFYLITRACFKWTRAEEAAND